MRSFSCACAEMRAVYKAGGEEALEKSGLLSHFSSDAAGSFFYSIPTTNKAERAFVCVHVFHHFAEQLQYVGWQSYGAASEGSGYEYVLVSFLQVFLAHSCTGLDSSLHIWRPRLRHRCVPTRPI